MSHKGWWFTADQPRRLGTHGSAISPLSHVRTIRPRDRETSNFLLYNIVILHIMINKTFNVSLWFQDYFLNFPLQWVAAASLSSGVPRPAPTQGAPRGVMTWRWRGSTSPSPHVEISIATTVLGFSSPRKGKTKLAQNAKRLLDSLIK